jgi:GT2 family glycosyltransferase
MSLPKVSLIIPTYLREDQLIDTIADAIVLDYPDYEVLVIDQTLTHNPKTESYLQQLKNEGKIIWYRLNWASLPGARNYGVKKAQGEIIVFIDDDVKMEKGFLKAHVSNYENPEIGGVAGRVLDSLETKSTAIKEYLPEQAKDPGIAWFYLDLVNTIKPQQVISGRGCNMSFRKELFTKQKLFFDERYRGSAIREESDFCLKIRKTGYKIWFDPEAYLVHLNEPKGGCHDLSTKSLEYQLTLYHNHYLMAFKHLTFGESLRLYVKMFDCHVLGHPPCNKSGSPLVIIGRSLFFVLGFLYASWTWIKTLWDDGQIYTKMEEV